MWPDRVSNPGPLTYESGALPTAQRGPAETNGHTFKGNSISTLRSKFFPVRVDPILRDFIP